MDKELTNILIRLNFISSIKIGDKVCVKTLTLVSKSSWIGALFRYWTDETRDSTIIELKNLSEDVRRISRYITIDHLNVLHEAVNKSVMGVNNLIQTYSKDTKMMKQLLEIISDYRKMSRLLDVRKELLIPVIQSTPKDIPTRPPSPDRFCFSAPSRLQNFDEVNTLEVPVFPSIDDTMYFSVDTMFA